MPKPPAWLKAAQDGWTNRGQARPEFAHEPAPGQESVWDYPRPPVIVKDGRQVIVTGAGGQQVASTTAAVRVLETASPPTFYLPIADIDMDQLTIVHGGSFCEWKGEARYWASTGDTTPIAWDYPSPFEAFANLADHLSFYPALVGCTVDGEAVQPQSGGFYGGWVTKEIVGPYKGEPGTGGW